MLRFIIGGVALVATGYGVAKLLEDECPSRSSSNVSRDDENIEEQEEIKDEEVKAEQKIEEKIEESK